MSTGSVPVLLEVPISRYPHLAEVAEARGFETVGELALSMINALAAVAPDSDDVALYVAQGFTDREIAKLLNRTNASVSERRRYLGLPANTERSIATATRNRKAPAHV